MLTLGNERILEVPVVFSCNLNCNYCAHLSQYMGQVPPVSLDALEQQFRDWSPRLVPRCIRIIGGEPLLHPNIEQVIELFAKYWGTEVSPLNSIELITNGMALNKISVRFYDLLERHNILLRVTLHHASFHDKLHTFLDGVKSRKHVSDYTEASFIQYYHIENGKPHLFTSDSKQSFDSCNIKRLCHELVDNKLYHCSVLAYFRKAHECGIIDDPRVFDYTPATPDMDDEELQAWYHSDFSNICGVCPEHKPAVYVCKWSDATRVADVYLKDTHKRMSRNG